jgi:glycerol-3-phosphate acyltransferase PlsY
MTILHILIAAYILGSIPFGVLLTRLAGLGDIRAIGSGNIGATNVLRTGKKALAAIVLILDALKGTVAVLLAATFQPTAVPLAALLVLLGHLIPIWLKFKGGKGVATALGIWLGMAPVIFSMMVAAWLVGAAVTRRSSVGALCAMIVSPVAVYFLLPELLPVALVIFALVILKHRANIARLLAGTEPKIGAA